MRDKSKAWKRKIQVFCSHLAPSMIEEVDEHPIQLTTGYDSEGAFVGRESLRIGMDVEAEEREKTGFA